ncbi:phosphatidate cytidylyltransferase [uncultured Dysosmobacter sp.]|uniref:phosphatidate cytidylyltransferase n=1 Tax=uncultured Dysosmobacter sp. TaxID=2591384 RepID=UPI00262A10AC|nr:phosphatidate cytidylyltransferase [uncultured Dysosmobacter sp.]
MKSRILVAVIGVPVLVWVVLWAPSVVMLAALCLLAGIGGMELQQCVSGVKRSELVGLSGICAVFTVEWYCDRPEHMAMLFMIEAALFFGYAIIKAGEVKFAQLMAGLFGSIAIGWSFSAFLRMEASGIHRAYLLLPFILSFACDTFAYFAGRAFGKHKLAPKVSPKKTIEGSIGGMAGNVVCGLLFAFVVDRGFGGSIGYVPMVLLALLCGVVAQMGDLSFSLIKREYGIKDYGRLFLEHGGVLDRFDSVLFVTPLIEIILNFVK